MGVLSPDTARRATAVLSQRIARWAAMAEAIPIILRAATARRPIRRGAALLAIARVEVTRAAVTEAAIVAAAARRTTLPHRVEEDMSPAVEDVALAEVGTTVGRLQAT